MSKQRPQPLSCEVEMNMLSRIMAKVGQHIELDRVLDTVITEICNALDLSAGCIYMFDDSTEELQLRIHKGLNPAFLEARHRLATGEGCAGTALMIKETFVPTKAERRFVCGTEQKLLGCSCMAAIPIVSQGKILAVLELFAPSQRHLTPDESELIEAISGQLAIAIGNASTYANLQLSLDNTRKLLRAVETITATLEFDTILEYLALLASELTRVSRVSIALYYPEKRELEFVVATAKQRKPGPQPLTMDLTSRRVYEKGETVASDNLADFSHYDHFLVEEESVRSILIVPLRFAGQTLGALYMDEPEEKHNFAPLEVELAEGIARHAAAAIQNARSLGSTKRALANAEGLLQAAGMVATIADPTILLKQLAGLAPKLIGVNRSAVCLRGQQADEVEIVVPPDREIAEGTICLLEGDQFTSVFRLGKTVLIDDLSAFPDPIRLSFIREKVESVLVVPLHYGANIVGALLLYDVGRRHEFTLDEINLAEGIAHHASIGVTNARSFSEQRSIAETLQHSFVPSRLPDIKGVKFGFDYRAASEAAFVGGDFFDFLDLDGRLTVCIGDVSGHGIEATSIAGMAKSTLRAFAYDARATPSTVMKRTNRVIARQISDNQFITLEYGIIDLKDRSFKYVSAGHPPPLFIHDGVTLLPVNPQVPLGIDSSTAYRQQTISLPRDSCLVFYTDGLIEARNQGRLFGIEGLIESAQVCLQKEPQALVNYILEDVETFSGHNLDDDIAIVAILIE
ncbi:MAG TPA: GAF domain-containing protein [Actinobacteria bacterium]|nr:GAF domain-containing protein [Actinomycetota bacterium]